VCPRCLLETAADAGVDDSTREPLPEPAPEDPSQIGGYRILERIGEGGMGVVYRAEQAEPVRRTVALKVIKHGMDTKQVIARFDAERQALALMDHPSIAKVFDAGETEGGRPYFVMEFVSGPPITEHCDRRRLSTDERLDLFARVCEGVQHAHQKGVIHRDLKPSNVLVGMQDGKPVPKIIDFGIAKATAMKLTEKTLFTELGVLIGTPEYMSPEQAEIRPEDVDTRSDVYSLGVLLYELLTGVLPFERRALREAGFDEIRRRIREEEPPKPSTRVSGLGRESTEPARNRRTDPGRLVLDLRGDLDWIVMKALEKDRERRYGSPSELALDLRRHLADEPVVAGPPSAAYRIRKFARRNRVTVTAAAAVLLALILGIIGTTIGLQRALHERGVARAETERADEVIDLLVGMFELADPRETAAEPMDARELLREGARKIEAEVGQRPLLRARLQHELAEIYAHLGDLEDARRLSALSLDTRREELGTNHPDTLRTMRRAAWIEERQGNLEESERIYGEAIAAARETLDEGDPELVRLLRGKGMLYKEWGRLDEAEALCLEAHAMAVRHLEPEHGARLGAMSALSMVWGEQGRHQESLEIKQELLEVRRRLSGEDHPDTLFLQGNIGHRLMVQKDYEIAAPILRDVLEREMRVLGPAHPATLWTTHNLGYVRLKQGALDEAESLLRTAWEGRRTVQGPRHPNTLNTACNLGRTLIGQRRYEEAVVLLDGTLDEMRAARGTDHPETLWATYLLGWAHEGAGRLKQAEALYLQALEGQRRLGGPRGKNTANRLAGLYELTGRVDESRALRSEFGQD
jgi:non-specific serine/threonine protein kinase/serine/threonine-protein kinase